MAFVTQVVVSGLTLGSVYALVGLGFVIVYKATRTLNFAHGDLLMLGAVIGLYVHVERAVPYWPTFLAVLVLMALLGVFVERVAYRPLAHAPEFTVILATAAVGGIIRSSVRITQEQQLSYFPPIFGAESFRVAGVSVSPLELGVIGISLGFVTAFSLFFQLTRTGKGMRAAAENPDAASLVGIKVPRVWAMAWGTSAAFAAAAGIQVAPLILITPDMGVVANKAFVGAVLGGFNSLLGTVLGGFVLGVLGNFIGVYVSTAYRDALTFVLLLAILLVKPTGLLGQRAQRRV